MSGYGYANGQSGNGKVKHIDVVKDLKDSGIMHRLRKPSHKLVMLYLGHCARRNPQDSEYRTCWPTQEDIAEGTGQTVRTVQTATEELARMGIIERQLCEKRTAKQRTAYYTYSIAEYSELCEIPQEAIEGATSGKDRRRFVDSKFHKTRAITVSGWAGRNGDQVPGRNGDQVPGRNGDQGGQGETVIAQREVDLEVEVEENIEEGIDLENPKEKSNDEHLAPSAAPDGAILENSDNQSQDQNLNGKVNGNTGAQSETNDVPVSEAVSPPSPPVADSPLPPIDRFDLLRIEKFGNSYRLNPEYQQLRDKVNSEIGPLPTREEKDPVLAVWCDRLETGSYREYLNHH